MLSTLRIYAAQRFGPKLSAGLTVFLYLCVTGGSRFVRADAYLFSALAALIFLLRLFDDLQSREYDMDRPGRIYTAQPAFEQLRMFLRIFTPLLLAAILAVHWWLGITASLFLAVNYGMYKLFLGNDLARRLLPLVKYPFLCMVFMAARGEGMPLSVEQTVTALGLFPLFILFEAMDDATFRLGVRERLWLFVLAFAVFLYQPLILPVVGMAFYFCFLHRSGYSRYVLLLSFLLCRILYLVK